MQSIIVYRNPVEAALWEGGGMIILLGFFVCVGLSTMFCLGVSDIVPKIIASFMHPSGPARRSSEFRIRSNIEKYFVWMLIIVSSFVLYAAHIIFST